MTENRRIDRTPVGVVLGELDLIPVLTARNFVVRSRNGLFHGFVVRTPNGIQGYVDRCPHMGLPLAQELDAYLTPDATLITCSWHGALFDPISGECIGGPCRGARLTEWPVHIEGDRIVTGPGPKDVDVSRSG